MERYKIQQAFSSGGVSFSPSHIPSDIQIKAACSIMNCKSGYLGHSLSQCLDCGHIEIHNNSCRNRSCPNCQAVLKEVWNRDIRICPVYGCMSMTHAGRTYAKT